MQIFYFHVEKINEYPVIHTHTGYFPNFSWRNKVAKRQPLHFSVFRPMSRFLLFSMGKKQVFGCNEMAAIVLKFQLCAIATNTNTVSSVNMYRMCSSFFFCWHQNFWWNVISIHDEISVIHHGIRSIENTCTLESCKKMFFLLLKIVFPG